MKTNRFEEILRRKLESIQPDFQDQDWDKWQAFNKLHGSPSFWQSYGHWLGYAVATVTTAVMVVLYVNQSNQNDALLKELGALKQRVELQSGSSATADSAARPASPTQEALAGRAPDTVYIVERRTVYREVPQGTPAIPEIRSPETPAENEVPPGQKADQPTPLPDQTDSPAPTPNGAQATGSNSVPETLSPDSQPLTQKKLPVKDENFTQKIKNIPDNQELQNKTQQAGTRGSEGTDASENRNSSTPAGTTASSSKGSLPEDDARTESPERIVLGELTAPPAQEFSNSRNYLYRRLLARIPSKSRPVSPPAVAQTIPDRVVKPVLKETTPKKAESESSVAEKKTEEVTKEESLLPKFGLNLPYRIGIGQQWQGKKRAFTLWNEVLIGNNWSVQAGVSWNKLETQRFVTEKMFRDYRREDFRNKHAKRLPPSFRIFNITAQTTLLQVPLGLTYRGSLGRDFTYLLGVSTALNLRAKQVLSFDFERPTQDYGQQSAGQYLPVPLLSSAQFSVGVEKRWSPIVLQAGPYVETQAKSFPFSRNGTQAGLRVKLLYEFGPVKKK